MANQLAIFQKKHTAKLLERCGFDSKGVMGKNMKQFPVEGEPELVRYVGTHQGAQVDVTRNLGTGDSLEKGAINGQFVSGTVSKEVNGKNVTINAKNKAELTIENGDEVMSIWNHDNDIKYFKGEDEARSYHT